MISRLDRRRRRRAVWGDRLRIIFVIGLAVFTIITIASTSPQLFRTSKLGVPATENDAARKTNARPPPARPAALRMVVRDATTSELVSRAVLGAGGEYVLANETGTITLTGLRAGRLGVTVRAPGYSISHQTLSLSAGENSATVTVRPGKEDKLAARSLWRKTLGPPPLKPAYLTIDDGPTLRWTPEVLDVLEKEDAKATFFVIGRRAARYPEIIRRIYVEGHTVGNHTYSHDYASLYRGSVRVYLKSLRKNGVLLEETLGFIPKLSRPPGGEAGNFRSGWRAAVRYAGYQTVSWNVSSGDGTSTTSKRMLENVQKYMDRLGDDEVPIILTHDVQSSIVEALPAIIAEVRGRGYKLVAMEP